MKRAAFLALLVLAGCDDVDPRKPIFQCVEYDRRLCERGRFVCHEGFSLTENADGELVCEFDPPIEKEDRR